LLLDAAGYWSFPMLLARFCGRIGLHEALRQVKWLPFSLVKLRHYSED
jgi:hypothetical protein